MPFNDVGCLKSVPELLFSVVFKFFRLADDGYRALGDGKRAVGVFYLVIARYDVYVAVFTHDGYLDGDFIHLATCIGKRSKFGYGDFMSFVFKQTDINAKRRVINLFV